MMLEIWKNWLTYKYKLGSSSKNLLANALNLEHCRGVPGKRDWRNGKLSCTCGWRPEPDLVERKISCYQSVLGASETPREESRGKSDRNLQDWKWQVCWLVVRSEKCPGTKVLRCRCTLCRGPAWKAGECTGWQGGGPANPAGRVKIPLRSVHYVFWGVYPSVRLWTGVAPKRVWYCFKVHQHFHTIIVLLYNNINYNNYIIILL